jgi:hypothetical protein
VGTELRHGGTFAGQPSYHEGLNGVRVQLRNRQQHRFSEKIHQQADRLLPEDRRLYKFRHSYPYYCYNIDQAKIGGFEWENDIKFDARNSLLLNYTTNTPPRATPTWDYGREQSQPGLLYNAKPWQAQYSIIFAGGNATARPYAKFMGGLYHSQFLPDRQLDKQRSLSVVVDNPLRQTLRRTSVSHAWPLLLRQLQAKI